MLANYALLIRKAIKRVPWQPLSPASILVVVGSKPRALWIGRGASFRNDLSEGLGLNERAGNRIEFSLAGDFQPDGFHNHRTIKKSPAWNEMIADKISQSMPVNGIL